MQRRLVWRCSAGWGGGAGRRTARVSRGVATWPGAADLAGAMAADGYCGIETKAVTSAVTRAANSKFSGPRALELEKQLHARSPAQCVPENCQEGRFLTRSIWIELKSLKHRLLQCFNFLNVSASKRATCARRGPCRMPPSPMLRLCCAVEWRMACATAFLSASSELAALSRKV